MLELSRTVTLGAMLRDESRGAHYKPDFPDRNDEQFLKTTKASFTGAQKDRSSSSRKWIRSSSSRGRDGTTQRSKHCREASDDILSEFAAADESKDAEVIRDERDHGNEDRHF